MTRNALRFLSLVFTSVAMAGGFAHLFEMPRKITLSRDEYLIVQQIYRGWALLGIAVVGALISTLALTVIVSNNRKMFYLTLTACVCIALSLAVFIAFTYPANQQTLNWTVLPDNWEQLRRQWEYSHATGAALYFIAFLSLALSLLVGRNN